MVTKKEKHLQMEEILQQVMMTLEGHHVFCQARPQKKQGSSKNSSWGADITTIPTTVAMSYSKKDQKIMNSEQPSNESLSI